MNAYYRNLSPKYQGFYGSYLPLTVTKLWFETFIMF